MEFLNSSKIENPRNPRNSGDPKKPANKPRKQPEQEHGRHGRGTTQGETPATQPHNRPTASNGNQQSASTATTGAKARAEHDDTKTKQTAPTPRRHPTEATPTQARHRTHANPPTHSPRHQRQTPATTGPAPSLENTKVFSRASRISSLMALSRRLNASLEPFALFSCFRSSSEQGCLLVVLTTSEPCVLFSSCATLSGRLALFSSLRRSLGLWLDVEPVDPPSLCRASLAGHCGLSGALRTFLVPLSLGYDCSDGCLVLLLPESRHTGKYRGLPAIIRHAKVHLTDIEGRTTPVTTRTNCPYPPVPVCVRFTSASRVSGGGARVSFHACRLRVSAGYCAFAPAVLAKVVVICGAWLLLSVEVPFLDVSAWQPPASSDIV